MTQISAVIITKNEEKNIGRCLTSLRDIADEIIVIDSNSTDKTEEICLSYFAKFIKRDFAGYSATKNFGNSLAQLPYILSIDADEELSEELRQTLLSMKSSMNADGYTVNRLTNYCGKWIKHCGWYPDTKLRIWKTGIGEWQGSIHEKVVMQQNNIKQLKGDLLHYSYPTVESHIRQINLFTELMATEMFGKNKKAGLCKILFSPRFKFFKKYILQLGFLDGYQGYVVCKMSAYYNFCKYAKLREMKNEK
ncbi:MAG: glycosyltransferase family 2 protein [Bacteroidetes bacterium]|nr:glycosyltransferase family 2 protein [Bacteroidota bacterium]MBU1718412.1 glycosyltransferase family 2 protein [Bacteroidota bacterium]